MTADLLIDADMYLFQAASACEVETDWGDDKWTLHSDAGQVRRVFQEKITEFLDTIPGANRVVLCFSDPSRRSFRHDLTHTYKQARKGTRKPITYAAIRDELVAGDGEWSNYDYKTIIKPRLEADDVMGIVSTRAPGKFVIVSGDKDMQQIPGLLYYQGELRETSTAQADRYHLIQTLTGDATDGYPGCPGIGAIRAELFVDGKVWPELKPWQRVVRLFKESKAKLTEADALLQARLARILRNTEWDFEKSEVKLWQP
jgi:DNA polymerase-1